MGGDTASVIDSMSPSSSSTCRSSWARGAGGKLRPAAHCLPLHRGPAEGRGDELAVGRRRLRSGGAGLPARASGARLFGFQEVPVIESWIPLFLFAILFGLSMDYHVFLLSRIKERYDQTGDNSGSVLYGLHATATIITGAALVMVAVFGGFALGPLSMFQQMGFGLAVAVILDATISPHGARAREHGTTGGTRTGTSQAGWNGSQRSASRGMSLIRPRQHRMPLQPLRRSPWTRDVIRR